MNVKTYLKKVFAFGLCVAFLMSLCACGKEDSWLFSVREEVLHKEDVAAFAYIYLTEYNVRNVEQLESIYEDKVTYGEYYKQQLEKDVMETVLLYQEAKEEKLSLSDEDKQQIRVNVENVLERFDEETMKEQGVSEDDIEAVYKMKMLGEAYLNQVLGESSEADDQEKQEQSRYVHVYQVTFPIVKLDEDGMLSTDAEGNIQKVASSEAEQMEQEAISFADQLQQGEAIEALLEKSSPGVTGMEKYLKYDDLDATYQKAIDEISQGECSGVIPSDYGFYVIKLLNANDKEYGDMLVSQGMVSGQASVRTQEVERLYSEYIQMNREYRNQAQWQEFAIEEYMK